MMMLLPFLLILTAAAWGDVSVTIPPPTTNAVQNNFLGISFELSFLNDYFGNDTKSVPPTMVTLLSNIRGRALGRNVLLRIGGNSMDSSTYVPEQTNQMIVFTNPDANLNDQPVTYGPLLWDVMNEVSKQIGGGQYLIGLSLRDPNSPNVPLLAGAAKQALGDKLDAFLLGNEPDLYTPHKIRPELANYTTFNYIDEFRESSDHLRSTSAGDLLATPSLGGPSICCNFWLSSLLDDGYLSNFTSILKYIALQHYPQHNCWGTPKYDLSYYLSHANVVDLAAWQKPGLDMVSSNKAPNAPKSIMSEFSSASCGGIPGISDTFGATLWTIDYALQMAQVGYAHAYLHTRERGISYNIVTPPTTPDGPWTANPTYYSLLVLPEALQSSSGSIVTDLNVANSAQPGSNATVAGYTVFNTESQVQQLVLLNLANETSTTFNLPAAAFANSTDKKNILVKYLTASSITENKDIAWGGETLSGVGDGRFVATTAPWASSNQNLDCSNGCNVSVPAPGLAVIFAANLPKIDTTSTTTTDGTGGATRVAKASWIFLIMFFITGLGLLL